MLCTVTGRRIQVRELPVKMQISAKVKPLNSYLLQIPDSSLCHQLMVSVNYRNAVSACPLTPWCQSTIHTLGFFFVFGCCFFGVPQLYLWGSPLLGETFAYVTVF